MDDITRAALEGSILKWEGIVAGIMKDEGRDNCPLCDLYWSLDCSGCPVKARSGHAFCENTPYSHYVRVAHADLFNIGMSDLVVSAAQEELDFLRSLREDPLAIDSESVQEIDSTRDSQACSDNEERLSTT